MLKYALKRLGRSLITILIILVVLFAMLQVMPEEGYFSNYEKMSPVIKAEIPLKQIWMLSGEE